MGFEYEDLPDLSGKTFLITGATSGLGQTEALQLAKRNAHVIIVGRSPEKIDATIKFIQEQANDANVEGMIADLMNLRSVEKFCQDFLDKEISLYSLTLNAGVYGSFVLSVDGIESQWQTNVVSQYHIVRRLLPALKKSEESRIVFVSSRMHRLARNQWSLSNDYISDPKKYNQLRRYGETKCAAVLIARRLANELVNEKIYVNVLHPGVVNTDILRNILLGPLRIVMRWFLLTPEEGAKSQTFLAASPEIVEKDYRGQYFEPRGQLSKPTTAVAINDEFGNQLCKFLESQIGSVLGELPYNL